MGNIVQNFTDNLSIFSGLDLATNQSFTVSNVVQNNFNFVSASIQIQLTTGTGTKANGSVVCYLARSVDNGVTLDDSSWQPLGAFNANVDNNTYTFSMDTGIAGTLPSWWGIVVYNNSGADFGSGSYIKYTGKQYYEF